MGKYIKLFNSHSDYEDFTESEDFILPNVSRCDSQKDIHYTPKPYDYSINYLTFKPLESGTFSFTTNNIDYSLDDGKTWTTLIAGTNTPVINSGNKILWKANELTPTVSSGIGTFSSTGQFEVCGNIMSLVYGDGFENNKSFPTSSSDNFRKLFYNCNGLINAEHLILPSTTLKVGCYKEMFKECVNLTKAPELPATSLTTECYYYMFYSCSSLTYVKADFTSNYDMSNCLTNWLGSVSQHGVFIKNPLLSTKASNSSGIYNTCEIPYTWTVLSSFTVVTSNINGEFTTTPAFWLFYDSGTRILNITLNNIEFSGTISWSSIYNTTNTYTGISGDKTLTLLFTVSRDRSGNVSGYSAKYTLENMTLNVGDIVNYSYYYKDVEE